MLGLLQHARLKTSQPSRYPDIELLDVLENDVGGRNLTRVAAGLGRSDTHIDVDNLTNADELFFLPIYSTRTNPFSTDEYYGLILREILAPDTFQRVGMVSIRETPSIRYRFEVEASCWRDFLPALIDKHSARRRKCV